MKLTWFGGTTLRVHIGGRIVVVDADLAPEGVDRRELLGAADRSVGLGEEGRPVVDADRWKPAIPRPLEDAPEMEVLSVGARTLLLSAVGEPPLLVADVVVLPHLGRWVDSAVIVLFGRRGVGLTKDIAILDLARPRLIALAASEEEIDQLFEDISERLDYTGLPDVSSLEPGLALEV